MELEDIIIDKGEKRVLIDFYNKGEKRISNLIISINENNINEINIPFGIYEENKTKIYLNDVFDYEPQIKMFKSSDNKYFYLNEFYKEGIVVKYNRYNNITNTYNNIITFKITIYNP